MAEPDYQYSLCGWRVASPIPLPELPALDAGGAPDIVIGFGAVPDQLDDAILTTPLIQMNEAGQAIYRIKGVVAYLVEHGSRVTIATALPREAPDVRLFLLGAVFGILCHQRGILPLHAATVEIDGEAVAFAGGSGAGKSTLASAFRRRGFRLLSDDVAPLDLQTMQFLPGTRLIRLWSDSARAADWPDAGVERCREGLDKFTRAYDEGFVTTPLAPRALFHLGRLKDADGEMMIRRLQGLDAFHRLARQIYRWRTFVGGIGRPAAMARAAQAAAAIPHHFELSRQFGYEGLDATIDAVVDTVRSSR